MRVKIPVYQTRAFARFGRKARISDATLWEATQRVHEGLIDADLGGGVIKQRIARTGEGKSGGFRSIILFKAGTRIVYVYAFEKKDRANIKQDEVEAFRELAKVILGYNSIEMDQRLRDGSLIQVLEPEGKRDD